MTTDFRALCAELSDALRNAIRVVYHEDGTQHISTAMPILRRARAALADGPAVPEGREPASVTGQPSDEELLETLDKATATFPPRHPEAEGLNAVEYPLALELRKARAVLARWGNPAPAPPADVSQLSDSYHTFAELYEHRYSLMLALMRALPRICWFSRRHADGELPFGSDDWFIVGAELPGAPITYHLPAALYSLAQKTGALELPVGRPWDGHSAADVVHRLRDWAIEPAPPADGEVAELVAWLRSTGEGQPCLSDEGYARLTRAADLLQRLSPPQPVPVSERLPVGVEQALIKAECALSDIAEGEPEENEGDADALLQWAERRAATALSRIRPVMRLHGILTSEWPPLPAHALPIPHQQENAND